jgi:titin
LESGNYSESFSLGNVLTYNDASLTNGQIYYYSIAAVNDIGEGPRSSEVFSTPMTLPSAPAFTQVGEGDAEVHLEWSAPNDGGSEITSYHLYRSDSGSDPETIVLGIVLSYTDVGLINGHTYSYRLSAVNGVGEGPLSAQVSAVPVTVPSVPMNLQALPGNSTVSLSWEAPIYSGPGQITYHLFRDGIEIWNGTGHSTVDSGLVNEMTYSYNIAAENDVGWGPNSTSVQATPSEVILPPTAPIDLQAIPGNGLVQLSWEAPAYVGMLPLTYHVFRDGALLWSGSDLGISDEDVSKGVEYVYSVAAESQIGWGANCSSVSAIPFGVPDTPSGLVGTPGDGQALVVWSPVGYSGPGALTYHLLRDGVEVYNGSVTSFNDVGLTNGQSYLYVLSATNSIGSSAFSAVLMVTPVGPPGAPNGLGASSGDGWVMLSWSPPTYGGPGPISYHIFRNGSLLWSGEGSAYNDSTVQNNHSYTYSVAAQNAIGWGPNSTSVSATPEGPATVIPGPPSGLVANVGDGKVQLTWQAPTEGASSVTGYNVYRKAGSGAWEMIATVNGTSYVDDEVTNGQEYSYKVSSIGSGGEGENTESAVIIPQSSEPNDDEGDNTLLFLGIGVLAVAAVLALLFVMRRKKQ